MIYEKAFLYTFIIVLFLRLSKTFVQRHFWTDKNFLLHEKLFWNNASIHFMEQIFCEKRKWILQKIFIIKDVIDWCYHSFMFSKRCRQVILFYPIRAYGLWFHFLWLIFDDPSGKLFVYRNRRKPDYSATNNNATDIVVRHKRYKATITVDVTVRNCIVQITELVSKHNHWSTDECKSPQLYVYTNDN